MENEGWTLNERLYHYGKLKAFDKALRKKDKVELLSIMQSVGLTNYDMSNVDFLLQHAKVDRLSFFEKIRNLFRK